MVGRWVVAVGGESLLGKYQEHASGMLRMIVKLFGKCWRYARSFYGAVWNVLEAR